MERTGNGRTTSREQLLDSAIAAGKIVPSRRAHYAQMYNRETGQQTEMRYINNQQCVQWADAAQTRCAVTAPN